MSRRRDPVRRARWSRARSASQCSGCHWWIDQGDACLHVDDRRLCVTCARALPFVGGVIACAWPDMSRGLR